MNLTVKKYTILTMIDIILLALIFYFVISGLQKGFLSYLLEFLLIVVCIFGSWLYYKETHNFLYSLIILFFSPIILAVIFRFLFSASLIKTQNIKWAGWVHLNNIIGGIIGFVWGIAWSVIIAGIINIIPLQNEGFLKVKESISDSFVLRFIKVMVPVKEVFVLDQINYLSEVMNSTEATKNLRTNPEFQKLLEHEKIQDFIKDRTVTEQLKNKQILSLVDNPKFIAIVEDLELLRKFINVDFESMLKYSGEQES